MNFVLLTVEVRVFNLSATSLLMVRALVAASRNAFKPELATPSPCSICSDKKRHDAFEKARETSKSRMIHSVTRGCCEY